MATNLLNDSRTAPLRLGIDLDGCVHDFVDGLRRTVSLRTGIPASSLKDPCCWDFAPHCWGMPVAEFLDHFAYGVTNRIIFATGDPTPGARETLHRLRADGHTLHVVTDRGGVGDRQIAEESTRAWLAEHDLPYDTLTFTADKTSVPTDLFVDDRAENYEALRAAGRAAVLFTQPWNAHLDEADRVGDWDEFYQLVTAN